MFYNQLMQIHTIWTAKFHGNTH